MATDIERFLAGMGTDGAGRTIDQVLDFDDAHWGRREAQDPRTLDRGCG